MTAPLYTKEISDAASRAMPSAGHHPSEKSNSHEDFVR